MIRPPPRSTRTDTLFPYTTLFRSLAALNRRYFRSQNSPATGRLGRTGIPTDFALLAGSLAGRSEEHTSELQSLMRISYAVFCLKKKTKLNNSTYHHNHIPTTPSTLHVKEKRKHSKHKSTNIT